MGDKIEVGEYVRTDKGQIFYIDGKKRLEGLKFLDVQYGNIVKHSKNIVELIEKGDYVNGYKVISIDYDVINNGFDCIELDLNNIYQYNFISIHQIKDIVTKEEFNSSKYVIPKEK